MQTTDIPYVTHSWNPLQDKIKGESGRGYHCTKTSPGCRSCWAEGVNMRFGNKLPFDGRQAEFEIMKKELEAPLRRKKPAVIGVQFMGDIGHKDVSGDALNRILFVIWTCSQHYFLMLTKRPKALADKIAAIHDDSSLYVPGKLKNLYIGTSICNQEEADEKIPILLSIPGKHFISYEPALGPLQVPEINKLMVGYRNSSNTKTIYDCYPTVDWVIAGCESGAGRRPAKTEWFRDLRDQCMAAGVPYFLKQRELAGEFVKMPPLDYKIWNQTPWEEKT